MRAHLYQTVKCVVATGGRATGVDARPVRSSSATRVMRLFAATACLTALLVGRTSPAADPPEKPAQRLVAATAVFPAELVAGFTKAKAAADTQFAKSLDAQAEQFKRGRGSPELRRVKLDEIAKAREEFRESGKLSVMDETVDEVLTYLDRVAKARFPLAKWYRAELERATIAGDTPRQNTLVKAMREVDALVANTAAFKPGSRWTGTRFNPLNSEPVALSVTKVQGATFVGVLDIAPGQQGPRLEVSGELDGSGIRFQATKVLRGKVRLVRGTGYVVGDRIYLRGSEVGVKGKQTSFSVMLGRR